MKTWVKISALGLLAAFISALGFKKVLLKLNKKGMNIFNYKATKKEATVKNLSKLMVLAMVTTLVFAGCAKKPVQEMNDAEAAINVVVNDGAGIYAKEELKKLQDELAAAKGEVDTQDKKFIKKYGKTREMLAKIGTDAAALRAIVAARKEEAKNNALSAQNEAKIALEEAKALLEKAPRGKGTQADIEAFSADLKALEDSLLEVQQAIDNEDYLGTVDKARIIKEKASAISNQIKQAMEKVKRR